MVLLLWLCRGLRFGEKFAELQRAAGQNVAAVEQVVLLENRWIIRRGRNAHLARLRIDVPHLPGAEVLV